MWKLGNGMSVVTSGAHSEMASGPRREGFGGYRCRVPVEGL